MALFGVEMMHEGNWEEAYFWLLEAALNNDLTAIGYMADMYRYGDYVRKDRKRADELVEVVNELGDGR